MGKTFEILMAALVITGCSGSLKLGNTSSGAKVSFEKAERDGYSLLIERGHNGDIHQDAAVKIGIYSPSGVSESLEAEYTSVKKRGQKLTASAELTYGSATFSVSDIWSISGDELNVERSVSVSGSSDMGFCTSLGLRSESDVKWAERKYLIPGIEYGEPHTTDFSKGGAKYYESKFFSIREDYLSAPLMVVANEDSHWIGMLNPGPNGNTTQEETTADARQVIIDERLAFGTLQVEECDGGGLGLSYTYPGTCKEYPGMIFQAQEKNESEVMTRRRCHPVRDGFKQEYRLKFMLSHSDSFPAVERDAWRWAWNTLAPKVETVNLEELRTVLIDHLAERVLSFNGRTGIPFVIDAQSGKPGSFRPKTMNFRARRQIEDLDGILKWAKAEGIEIDPSADELNIWPYAVLGFCGKHMEIAEQFLLESYRTDGQRSAKFRSLAESIMETFVKNVPMNGPVGEGIDLRTGRVGNIHGGKSFGLRPIPEDIARLLDLIVREKARGIDHPDWLAWGKSFADWLLPQQKENGSFPDGWDDNGKVNTPEGAMSYSPIPMYVKLSEICGEKKYLDAAVSAGEYLWDKYGQNGVYQGATGNSNVADKESGMLSTEAFLSLYEKTGDAKWLERAQRAADYTETWIWIWNVPMPEGADPAGLGWKPGVPTIGVNGIGSNDVGGVDQYLDWAVPQYAKLYKYSSDGHYLDVARILLHGTKSMLALPGRTYDLAGPGWQQEHWRMGPVRGIGAHRTWLPWISINHLHGITALEEFDKELYRELSE